VNKYKLRMKTLTGLGNEYVYVYATSNFERYLNIHKLGYARNITKDYQLTDRFEQLQQENTELKDKLSLANQMNENNYERYCESLKENQKLQYQIEIMEKYLELIVDLGFDFDGCNTVESLKGLVEELVHLASLARACNLTETIYENGGKKYNILHEEIENNE